MSDGFFVETKDFVLFGLAIYGAALSTVGVVLAILRNRRHLRISCTVSYYVEPGRFEPYFQVEAVNKGTRPVTVTSINIKLPNGKFMMAHPNYDDVQLRANTQLPATLADGESAKMMVALDKLKEGLRNWDLTGEVELLPQVGDSAGNTHEGDAFLLDTTEA